MTGASEAGRNAHWEHYYSEIGAPVLPSQFCVFVANEFGAPTTVVEFGCGNGRDSLFFARHGWNVIGVDASEAAIAECRRKSEGNGDRVAFIRAEVGDSSCYVAVSDILAERPDGPMLVYARFFLHAIDEANQAALLTGAYELLARRGGVLAVEFRTERDASLNKTTEQHYRRFISPSSFAIEAAAKGFSVAYFIEGFGFAKYRDDDAHVARFLLTPDRS